MKKLILYILFVVAAWLWQPTLSAAQQNSPTLVLINATIHTGTGKVIEKGVMVVENGKLVYVGAQTQSLYKNAKAIDLQGKHVYPGLICMNSAMGLSEIDAVRATQDYNEVGGINPNVRTQIAYNTDSKILPTALYTGILYTQATPAGGLLSGSSSVMKTRAWNWEDATVLDNDGVHLNMPNLNSTHAAQQKNAEEQWNEVMQFFADAQVYAQMKPAAFNARLAAMQPVLSGQKNLYIHVNDARGIIRAVQFFSSHYPAIRLVIVGATDAWQITDFLATHHVKVVLSNIHRLPARNAEAIDQPYKTPSALVKAGVEVALAYEGSWESRNLAYLAGTASAYGLSREEALQTVTLTPARIMGVDKELGSLEAGKNASFVISEGDLLDMKSSVISMIFIDGVAVEMKNDQTELYQKYMRKYGLK